MNREILFRAKGLHDKKWIIGSLISLDDDHVFIVPQFPNASTLTCAQMAQMTMTIVAPETVGQYTGLTDKNGTMIFEGDIVICRQYLGGNFIDYHIKIGYIEMKFGAFGLHRKQGYYRPFKDWLEDYEYEVIGNIHDNPELLKKERTE